MSIYVLKLIQNKFYVGRSENVVQRFQQHQDCLGSAWTRKYPVVGLAETLPVTDFGELSTTLRYMKMYGIENVRGDVYSNINLTSRQIDDINLHIRHENGLCLKCGSDEHFMADCKQSFWTKLFCCYRRIEPSELTMPLYGSQIVDFGKYEGSTYENVWKRHPSYCKWVMNQESSSERFNKFKEWCFNKDTSQ